MITATKKFIGFPFAHRQHTHPGHCRFIHGHNWDFTFTFGSGSLDNNGFVIDFGALKWLKEWLESQFDHTLVLNENDPALEFLRKGLTDSNGCLADIEDHYPFAKITVVPNCGAEGLAKYLHTEVNRLLTCRTPGRDVWVLAVTVHENERNSATYTA